MTPDTEKDPNITPEGNTSTDKLPSRKTRRSRSRPFALFLFLVVLCFAVGYGGYYLAGRDNGVSTSDLTSIADSNNDGNKIVSDSEQSIADLVNAVSPSVVSVVTSTNSRAQAAGTGMIVSKNGYVLTNKHVVSGANSVSLIASDGKTYDNVKIVGTDPLNDIAFLKIPNVSDLPAITIGDSKTIRIGQSVVAIGNALGQYQNTVTSGIISGLGRPVIASADGSLNAESESLTDLVQTDAAINSGNSGGPLLNMRGQVVGINTAVAQDAQSIGFAIPIGAAKGMLANLVATGNIERAVVGLQYTSITPEISAERKLPVTRGDLVIATSGKAIKEGSPAGEAGIENGDIITKVNEDEIGPGHSISTLVGEYTPGDEVTLTILRDGKTITKKLTLAAF